MKKAAVFVVIAGAVFAVIQMRRRRTGGARPSVWQKMQEGMETMPEDFPPRVMFDNVAAVRENTERILEVLHESSVSVGQEPAGV